MVPHVKFWIINFEKILRIVMRGLFDLGRVENVTFRMFNFKKNMWVAGIDLKVLGSITF